MKNVTALLVAMLVVGGVRGVGGSEPGGAYCAGTQCFTAFQETGDFAAAGAQCARIHGHLMTVRSSAARDVLHILLGNFSGRFWIGLHRPTGCPDPSAELRGFQWVTSDGATDLLDWAPTFDSSCAAPRCVTVSTVDKFQWVLDWCKGPVAGFVCEHSFRDPCAGLTVGVGESVSYVTPFGFRTDDVPSLPPGTIAVLMPAESKRVCSSQRWLQAPWTCEIWEGGCEHGCTTDPDHGPVCYCPPGHIVNDDNWVTCEVAADDPCLAMRCQHACYDDGESHVCTCDPGYVLAQDGRACVDFDDCADERQCSGDNNKCVNVPGGFECVCVDGYRPDGNGQCVDVNECLSAPCEHRCDNTPGGYRCSCYDGYKSHPESPHKCQLFCGAEVCDAECDPNDRSQCYCPDGYVSEERPDRTVCWDIDECESNFCQQGCENTYGGYACRCGPGHALVDGWRCVKDEEESASAPTATPRPPTVEPTRKPSGVSAAALGGLIVCTVMVVLVVLFLIHVVLSGRRKTESARALKAAGGDVHGLRQEATDAC